jgi:protein O-GlcNAc transferase
MPQAFSTLQEPLLSSASSASPFGTPGCEADTAISFDQLRTALSGYLENPQSPEAWDALLAARRAACGAILRLPRKEMQSPLAGDARLLVREFADSGAHDRAVEQGDLSLAQSYVKKGWQGLLAAMLLTPAWQWADSPLLLAVPDWLRKDYVAWLFAAPKGFSEPGDAAKYGAFVLGRLEELDRWVNRGPGAAAVADVLAVFGGQYSAIPLYFSAGSLRRHAEIRGRLLTRILGQPDDRYDPPIQPRAGRRLRVGFVNRHFGSQTETYTTLPMFAQLDPERFEVQLYCHQSGGGELEAHCRKQAADFVVLPEFLADQLALLRAAALDVVVFGTNITAVCNEVLTLALHRVAPLQVINNSSCVTSGLPNADLYLSGDLTETTGAAAHFSERLGLLPGPTHAFEYEADRKDPQVACSRGEFGIPEDALLFVSAANYFKVIPEMQHAWARLLAAVPGSRLLLHPFNPNWSSSYPIKRFQADFERVLTGHGVAPDRLSISTKSFPSRTDVKTLLGLGNVYLDTYPFGGVNSLVDPLELGMPVVTWEGGTMRSRMGSALLRSLGLPQMIATDGDSYHRIAAGLATDPALRAELGSLIKAKMERTPVFLDTLASGDAVGALIETAFDELVAKGRVGFRRETSELRMPQVDADAVLTEGEGLLNSGNNAGALSCALRLLKAEPASPKARKLMGRTLMARGWHARAVNYLLAALQGDSKDATLWYDIARASYLNNWVAQALQALEGCLRIDPRCVQGWVMLMELSDKAGNIALLREALATVREIAPEDPQVVAWTAKLASSGNG